MNRVQLIAMAAFGTLMWVLSYIYHHERRDPPALRPCTFSVGETKVEGALHEQENGKFCIPYAD